MTKISSFSHEYRLGARENNREVITRRLRELLSRDLKAFVDELKNLSFNQDVPPATRLNAIALSLAYLAGKPESQSALNVNATSSITVAHLMAARGDVVKQLTSEPLPVVRDLEPLDETEVLPARKVLRWVSTKTLRPVQPVPDSVPVVAPVAQTEAAAAPNAALSVAPQAVPEPAPAAPPVPETETRASQDDEVEATGGFVVEGRTC